MGELQRHKRVEACWGSGVGSAAGAASGRAPSRPVVGRGTQPPELLAGPGGQRVTTTSLAPGALRGRAAVRERARGIRRYSAAAIPRLRHRSSNPGAERSGMPTCTRREAVEQGTRRHLRRSQQLSRRQHDSATPESPRGIMAAANQFTRTVPDRLHPPGVRPSHNAGVCEHVHLRCKPARPVSGECSAATPASDIWR